MAQRTRLQNLKPSIAILAPRLGYQPGDAKARIEANDEKRDAAQPWRQWYSTARWQKLRMQVLVRDLFICQRTGVPLRGKYPAPDSPVADHKIQHRGDPDLFWNPNNIEAVSKEYHDSFKERMERTGKKASFYPAWLRPSIIPLTIICGAPGSGKSTYARQHAGPNNIIIDLDEIASSLSGEPLHTWDRDNWLHPALFKRNDMLGDLSRPSRYVEAWFIVSEPKSAHRAWWQRTLKPHELIVFETSEAQCIANAAKDQDRDQKTTADAIVRWWFEYERGGGETVLKSPQF